MRAMSYVSKKKWAIISEKWNDLRYSYLNNITLARKDALYRASKLNFVARRRSGKARRSLSLSLSLTLSRLSSRHILVADHLASYGGDATSHSSGNREAHQHHVVVVVGVGRDGPRHGQTTRHVSSHSVVSSYFPEKVNSSSIALSRYDCL